MMKQILRDYRRAHISTPIRFAFVTAVCIGAFFLTGIFSRDSTRIAGIVVSAFLAGVVIWAAVDIFAVAPRKFKKDIERLTEAEREEVLSGYETAPKLGARRFYRDKYVLFYSYRRMFLLKYDEIVSAEPKGARGENIFLMLSNGKTVLMPVQPNENSAVIMAALRAGNPDIKVYINGRLVTDKEAADGKDDITE